MLTAFGQEACRLPGNREKERFGPLHNDVVDTHGNVRISDGVMAVSHKGYLAARVTPSLVPDTSTGFLYSAVFNENRPPKPPISAMTSGRDVALTNGLIMLTKLLPAAMSYPGILVGYPLFAQTLYLLQHSFHPGNWM